MRWVLPAIVAVTLAAPEPLKAQQAEAVPDAEDGGPPLVDDELVEWSWPARIPAPMPHPAVRLDNLSSKRSVRIPDEAPPRVLQLSSRDRRRPDRPDLPVLEETLRDMERTISDGILRSGSSLQPTHRATVGDESAEVRSPRRDATPPSGSAPTTAVPQAGGSRPPW